MESGGTRLNADRSDWTSGILSGLKSRLLA